MLNKESRHYKLTDFFKDIQNGKSINELTFKNGSYPVYGSSEILFYSNKFQFKEDAIIIGRVGENCGCIQIGKSPFWASDNTIVCFIKNEYNIYYIKSLLEKIDLHKLQNGSGQPLLTATVLKNIEFSLENTFLQMNEIGNRIKNIEDLIVKNNNIINVLTNKIKDIYSYWFVGNYAKVMFNEGLEFAKKSIVDNELCSLISSGIQKFSGLKDYFSTSEVNGSTYKSANNLITYEKRESRANMQPLPFSVWFAKMKNSIKHISFSKQSYLEKRIILSTGFAGLKCSELTYPYIWSIINTQSWFEKQKDYIATGSTQEALNETTLSYIKIEIPNNDCLAEYYKQTQQLILLIEKLMELNKHLLDYKTELLYKLIK